MPGKLRKPGVPASNSALKLHCVISPYSSYSTSPFTVDIFSEIYVYNIIYYQ